MRTLEEQRADLRRARVKLNFDSKYYDQGGSDKLVQLVEAGATQRQAADHFGLQPPRIATIYTTITGKPWPYGPGVRKEAK